MPKMDRRKTAKKVAPKAVAKTAANGRAASRTNAVHKNGAASLKIAARSLKNGARSHIKPKRRQGAIVLPDGYQPSENDPFMNEQQRLYFRNKLVAWKEEIIRQNRETLNVLHEDSAQHADLADRATSETDRALELRARDRQRKLVAKIDAALARIEEGTYGYCEDTGEPIGIKRLEARPIATLSLEAQERHERREKVFRED
jgi:RNA polymerase-binding transcription factor